MKHTPYLLFDGDCADALAFYARLLGGRVTHVMRFTDLAPDQVVAGDEMKLGHGRVTGGKFDIMASDAWPGRYHGHEGFSMMTGFDDRDEALAFFRAVSEGGEILMDVTETSFSTGFGTCRDRFGVPWMVNVNQGPA